MNSKSASKKNTTQKNPNLLQKLKELAADSEYDEEILSNLIPQTDSDNREKPRNHIIKNSTSFQS